MKLRIGVRVVKRIVHLTITAGPSPDHRVVHVVAENEDSFRSSSFELPKGRSQEVFRWIGLRPGIYQLTATLMDSGGKRISSAQALVNIPL